VIGNYKFLTQAHISAIQQLSDNDKPAYFGLPANVERSWQRITSHEVINQLKSKYRGRVFLFAKVQYAQCSGIMFKSTPSCKFHGIKSWW
jgi:hypothetical protein